MTIQELVQAVTSHIADWTTLNLIYGTLVILVLHEISIFGITHKGGSRASDNERIVFITVYNVILVASTLISIDSSFYQALIVPNVFYTLFLTELSIGAIRWQISKQAWYKNPLTKH